MSRVLDIKTPGSAEVHRNRWENLPLLTPHDQVKFVICGRADFEWAKAIIAEHRLTEHCDVLFSPSQAQIAPRLLADWIVAGKVPVRFQMQLHKFCGMTSLAVDGSSVVRHSRAGGNPETCCFSIRNAERRFFIRGCPR